eukprot:5995312-Prymnesium_polylepis.1
MSSLAIFLAPPSPIPLPAVGESGGGAACGERRAMRVCRQRILGQFCEAAWCIVESSVAVLNTGRRNGGREAGGAGEARTADVPEDECGAAPA